MLGVRQESFHRWVTGLGRTAAVLGVRVSDWGGMCCVGVSIYK